MADANSSRPPMHSRSSNGTPLYKRICACGAISVVDARRINLSCHSCAMVERRTHGLSAGGKLDPIYSVFCGIKARCFIPSRAQYKYYGGRGITICKEWLDDPATFVAWAKSKGWKPGLEIDRIESDGDYTPDNCQISTHRENSQHTRRIHTTLDQAKRARELLATGISVKEVAKAVGISYMSAWHIKNTRGVWSNA